MGAVLSACPGSSTVVTDDPKRPGGPGYEQPVSRYACQVQQLLVDRCRSCHGAIPSEGAPMPLRTLHDLRLSSHVDGTLTQAQRSLIRMRDDAQPMPPAPHAPATAEEIATLEGWINEGMLSCTEGPGGAPIAFESPNLLDQASLFSCTPGTRSDAPTRLRRMNRRQFTRNVGGSVQRSWTGFSFNDNPLDPSAIEQYSTWATDETLDESTVELLLPLANAAGDVWTSVYETANPLLLLRSDQRLQPMLQSASPSAEDLRYFLSRLLRYGVYFRDPDDGELDRLQAFAETVLASEGGFSTAKRRHSIRRITDAAWLSAGALFRTELGTPTEEGRVALTSWELAQQLTYVLGNRAPGATPTYMWINGHGEWFSAGAQGHYADITAAAADGSITDPAVVDALFRANFGGINTGSEGLLAREDLIPDLSTDWRAARAHHWLGDGAAGFFREWLDYGDVYSVFKEWPMRTSRFEDDGNSAYSYGNLQGGDFCCEPGFIPLLDDMIARVVMEDTDVLKNLLTTRRFYLPATENAAWNHTQFTGHPFNVDNASVTIPATVEGRWVELPANERAGVLTHPAWLSAHGGNFEDDPSIVHRGLWIRENLLCDYVPPLSSVQVDAQVGPSSPRLNARRRLQEATSGAQCQGCHRLMEPLGIPFEIYNHAGYLRVKDHAPDGGWTAPDGSVTLVAMPEAGLEGQVTDAVELMERLADSQHVKRCFIRQAFRYYMGRPENPTDACTLTRMEQAYDADGGSFISMISALITSDTWTTRREPQAGE